MNKEFEKFCQEFNLDYDFSMIGDQYKSHETHKAFCVFAAKEAENQWGTREDVLEEGDRAMKKYFSFDSLEGEFDLHETLEEARCEAEKYLETYRDEAYSEGWPDGLAGSVGYGEIKGITVEKIIADRQDYESDEEWSDDGYNTDFDYVAEYNLKEPE